MQHLDDIDLMGGEQGHHRDEGARPISEDLPALVRTLTATTALTLSHDSGFIGRDADPARALGVVERLWLY